MMLNVKFKKEHRCFAKGEKIDFRPGVNLMVGDQGVGKSTLFQLFRGLMAGDALEKKETAEIIDVRTDERGVRGFFYDFEKDNPRTSASFGFTNSGGAIPLAFQAHSFYRSHGEVNRLIFEGLAENLKGKGSAAFMDEPDTGLSARTVLAFVDELKRMAKNHQLIASVHHPWIIEAFPEVLSLEHRKWMPSADFLAAMRQPRKSEP